MGTINDLPAIATMLYEEGLAARQPGGCVWFHTDAVQAPGHVPTMNVQLLGVDFLTASAHKFHGPPDGPVAPPPGDARRNRAGVGFLYRPVVRPPWPSGRTSAWQRDPTRLNPLMYGGHQQGGLRPGSEPVGLIRAMVAAFDDAVGNTKGRTAVLRSMTDAVWQALQPYIVSGLVRPTGAIHMGKYRAPHHVSFCVRGANRRWLVQELSNAGIMTGPGPGDVRGGPASAGPASGGSACNTGSRLPSHVLGALNVPPEYIHGSLRFTFSHTNTLDEITTQLIPKLRTLLDAAAAMSSAKVSKA